MESTRDSWEGWERTRRLGRTRFVWLYGVCGVGLAFGCLSAAMQLAERHHPTPELLAVVALAFGPVAGYIWGRILWAGMEARYLAARGADRIKQEQTAAIDALSQEIRELREATARQATRLEEPQR
jgi:hypothetical protein